MSSRGIHVSSPARLSVQHASLCISQAGAGECTIPLEDINYIILESRQTDLSSTLLSECANKACLVITCDEKHMPNGALLPFHSFYRQQEMLNGQLGFTLPQQKKLWQQVIKSKIRNQATCLHRLGKDVNSVRAVAILEQKVSSGDQGNIEALAARLYWSNFSDRFKRDFDGEDRLNAMLNYGYAIIRAAIARDLAASGFVPCLGIHHKSQGNAFNLADDLIEPWRPFVDLHAALHFRTQPGGKDLLKEDRQVMAGILGADVMFENGTCMLLSALERYIEQVRSCYMQRGIVSFPDFPVSGGSQCQEME